MNKGLHHVIMTVMMPCGHNPAFFRNPAPQKMIHDPVLPFLFLHHTKRKAIQIQLSECGEESIDQISTSKQTRFLCDSNPTAFLSLRSHVCRVWFISLDPLINETLIDLLFFLTPDPMIHHSLSNSLSPSIVSWNQMRRSDKETAEKSVVSELLPAFLCIFQEIWPRGLTMYVRVSNDFPFHSSIDPCISHPSIYSTSIDWLLISRRDRDQTWFPHSHIHWRLRMWDYDFDFNFCCRGFL